MHSIALQRGSTLLEVLITVVIISTGLLGLAGLQTRMQISQVESYQRSQALILLSDMANRIETNRGSAAGYVTGAATPLGSGMTCAVTTITSTRQQIDTAQWCLALQGASETFNGSKAGAMIGGRGCIEDLGSNEYLVTIAWQGEAPIAVPPAGIACGQNLYNTVGSSCTGDACRRTVTTVVRIASLT